MKLSEIAKQQATKFKLQSADSNKGNWEDLSDEPVSREDALEFLDQSPDDHLSKHRAVGVDAKEVLLRPVKPDTKSTLARHASPTVHKRNADFFDKYL